MVQFKVFLKNSSKKLIGEYANGHWHDIENFLSFNKHNRAILVIRDPAGGIFMEKITFSKKIKYLNSIFNGSSVIHLKLIGIVKRDIY